MSIPNQLNALGHAVPGQSDSVAIVARRPGVSPWKVVRLALIYVLSFLIIATTMIPVLWMVKTSFETPEFMHSLQIQFWPVKFTWQNYLDVLGNPNALIIRSAFNSLV